MDQPPSGTSWPSSSAAHALTFDLHQPQDDTEHEDDGELDLPRLSEQLHLDELWNTLGECLTQLASTTDHHVVLVLQPTVEAFFMVHAGVCSFGSHA